MKVIYFCLISFMLFESPIASSVRHYCQPGESCWPTTEEVEQFKSYLSPTNEECYTLPTFSSLDEPGDFIWNRWYADEPHFVKAYDLLNFRNHNTDRKGYFVVLARTQNDVIESVKFATAHNIGVSVFSTGHEFNDRGGGPSSNTLLIRTTCLRSVEFDLNEENRFGHSDGVVRLGTGLTWGTSILGYEGVHEMAEARKRVVISGHAANVGIVGWSLGGGHSQLGPLHGLGADQILEVELVGADGSLIITNANGTDVYNGMHHQYIENDDLLWALRGGGGGTWGILTAMTIKVHKPRNECESNCYTQWQAVWMGKIEKGSQMFKDLTKAYLKWGVTASKFWSSYGMLFPYEDYFYFVIGDALFVGNEDDGEDYWSLISAFQDLYPAHRVNLVNETFDTYWQKATHQTPEAVYPSQPMESLASFLLNDSMALNDEMVDDLIDDVGFFGCIKNPLKPCLSSIQFMHTIPRNGEEVPEAAVSPKFRQSKMHMVQTAAYQLEKNLTYEERQKFTSDVAGPTLYKYSDAAYFSESDYGAKDWKIRYWGEENYQRLLKIKMKWDPTMVFGCHHCIGDEESPGRVNENTLPYWRFYSNLRI